MSDEKDVQQMQEAHAVTTEDNLLLEEVLRGYRIVYFNEDHFLARRFKINSIRIYDRTVLALSRYGDQLFTRTRNRLMKDPDMLTYEEQMKILKERDMWDESRETELLKLRDEAKELQEERNRILSKLSTSKKKADIEKYKKEEAKLIELFQKVYVKYAELTNLNLIYFQDTIEMQAQTQQRLGWIVSCVCKHDEKDPDEYNLDNRIWKSVEDLEKDLKKETLEVLLNECTMFWEFSGTGEDSFFAESPGELKSDLDSEAQSD